MNRYLIQRRLKDAYRKNAGEMGSLLQRKFPKFVFSNSVKSLGNEIPVFVFHDVETDEFEALIEYLSNNDYKTLNSDELRGVLQKDSPPAERMVALTFDDGTKSLLEVAHPIFKKYGQCGISFLNPGLMANEVDSQMKKLCTWEEIKIMHDAGTIDFQSHTMYHNQFFTSTKIEYFANPWMEISDYGYCIAFHDNGSDKYLRSADLGTPIYQFAPQMTAVPRFYDQEALRRSCVDFVTKNGGNDFFFSKGWMRELEHHFHSQKKQSGDHGYVESYDEMMESIRIDLLTCKQTIEKQLFNKTVDHFCFPFFMGSDKVIPVLKETGYRAAHWGILPGRISNNIGDDPFHIVRVRPEFIYRLPGNSRKSLGSILRSMYFRKLPLFSKAGLNG